MAPATVPDLAHDLGLSPGIAAGAIITAFHALALFIEAPLLAWADRGRVRVVSSVSLLAVAAVTLLAALAPGPVTLLLALALYGPAIGCATAAAEGVLVESRPHERERTMTRWTLAGVVGDLAVPVLLALFAALGLGWRATMATAAAVSLALAVTHARAVELDRPMASGSLDDDDGDDGDAPDSADDAAGASRPPLGELLGILRRTPALLGWSFAGVAINLLDEVLVAFAVVHLDASLHAGALARSVAVGAWTLGGIIGLLGLDRALARFAPLRILTLASAVTALALAVFAFAGSPAVAIMALAFVGASSSTFHPLTRARAYAALPGRPALVNAVAALLVPLDALAPLGLAAIATRLGSRAAMLALLIGPLAIGIAAVMAILRAKTAAK